MKKFFVFFFNFIVFVFLSAVIGVLWWQWAGRDYLFAISPIGSDYFNALTYANFFKNNLDLPPRTWIPFWNEGSPVVGGYPWFVFYLIYPLTKFFDIATAMEIFAVGSLLLFLLASLLLFWQVSKNWLVAAVLTLIVTATRATYYPLMTGGFVSSATAQWYLPIVLFFIYKLGETRKNMHLVLASAFAGLSLLHHAPTSLLMIVAPATVALALIPGFDVKKRVTQLLIFLILSSIIGSMGLYTVFLQTYFGSGTGTCASPQCWGIYPKHLIVWMNLLAAFVVGAFLLVTLIAKLLKKETNLSLALPAVGGFTVFALYALAANLHLINGLANVIFPTRTFWAVNLFLLLIAASFFRTLASSFPKLSYIVGGVALVSIAAATYLYYPLKVHHDFNATVPMDVATYVIPKYQSNSLNELIPDWLPINETDWRLDTFNPGLTHWWNFIAQTPSTRGYSNHPIGVHQDWQYFLQVATREPPDKNQELVKNRALFLIDAYSIRYRENSIASYPPSVLNDPQITIRSDRHRDFIWYELSQDATSPIVFPSTSPAVLFIGDKLGYENFIRAAALVNLNSHILVPVKGPENFDRIDAEELRKFKALILYRFKGNNWSKLAQYVKEGGSVFVDTGSIADYQPRKPSDLFPITTLTTTSIKGNWNTEGGDSRLLKEIDTASFSPFEFEGGPWKLSTAPTSALRDWAKPVLTREDKLLFVEGSLGKGKVVWSGTNLLFHIASNDNFEESKLFKNVMNELVEKISIQPTVHVRRPLPEKIEIEGNNFSGVFFKENYHSGWKARVNGKEIPLYKAGLDFMYVPIPNNLAGHKLNVEIKFVGSLTSWFLFYLTLFTFSLSILYLLVPMPFNKAILFLQKRQKETFIWIHEWWKKE